MFVSLSFHHFLIPVFCPCMNTERTISLGKPVTKRKLCSLRYTKLRSPGSCSALALFKIQLKSMRSAELVHFPLLFSFDLGLPGSLRMPGRDSQISASQPHSYKARETTLGRKSITGALCLISIPKTSTLGPGAAPSELILIPQEPPSQTGNSGSFSPCDTAPHPHPAKRPQLLPSFCPCQNSILTSNPGTSSTSLSKAPNPSLLSRPPPPRAGTAAPRSNPCLQHVRRSLLVAPVLPKIPGFTSPPAW